MRFFVIASIFVLLSSCSLYHKEPSSDTVVSLQLVDRNGMTETISNNERLKLYRSTDFLASQPYQKVLRVYGRNPEGSVPSKMTAYHPNGQIWQYLEVLDGRAHGSYLEWYPNGQQKIESFLMEGSADLSDLAKLSWVFDNTSTVWDDQGHPLAIIEYNKGVLDTPALYFYPSGELKQIIPYRKGVIDGLALTYSEEGLITEKVRYVLGQKEGHAEGFFLDGDLLYEEDYTAGLLKEAKYYLSPGAPPIASVFQGFGKKAVFTHGFVERFIEIREGIENGLVEIFRPNGDLFISYTQVDGKKTGEEIEYYPKGSHKTCRPKISLNWHEDVLHGLVKTWYDNGNLESQRELHNNQKEGLSFAWYKNGDLLCVEEYEGDRLIKGSYFKRGDKNPVSKIEEGKGTATLYSSEGLFLKKISYEKGCPIP